MTYDDGPSGDSERRARILDHARRRILLAEREPANRRLISGTLRADGHAIDEVSTAGELEARDLSRYDLFIASKDLLDDAKHIELGRVPLVVMSPAPSRGCARQYGAHTCIHRPIYVDELRGAIAACLERSDELDEPAELSKPPLLDAGLATV